MALLWRHWFIALVASVVILAGSPALWAQAQEEGDGAAGQEPFRRTGVSGSYADLRSRDDEFSAAFTPIVEEGLTGNILYLDTESAPGTNCGTYANTTVPTTDIVVNLPVVYPSGNYNQVVSVEMALFQRLSASNVEFLGRSGAFFDVASPSFPVDFGVYTLIDAPVGPVFTTVVDIIWYDGGGFVDGHLAYLIDYYGTYVNDGSGWEFLGLADACYPLFEPDASLSPTTGIVNQTVAFDIAFYPVEVPVTIMWDTKTLGSAETDFLGRAAGTFKVPASPMGAHTVSFVAGDWVSTATFTVKPRIKVTPAVAERGDIVNVSLRGFVAREMVRIRWKQGSSWVEIDQVTTSNTGSANVNVEVPSWAPDGLNSIRGDSTSGGGRAQTNAFTVVSPNVGSLALSANRGTVNSSVTATVSDFPPNTEVTVTFPGFNVATDTAMTNELGEATLSFRVPASPLGTYTVEAVGGGTEATASYEIVPRIKVIPSMGERGTTVNVSLRGYGARQEIRIRWEGDDGFEEITRVMTSGSGSANVNIAVPLFAPDGSNSVRGDATSATGGRAQTNAFTVTGGPIEAAESSASESTATPEGLPSATPTVTPEPTPPLPTVEPAPDPTATPEETASATATAEPTVTESPTPETPPEELLPTPTESVEEAPSE